MRSEDFNLLYFNLLCLFAALIGGGRARTCVHVFDVKISAFLDTRGKDPMTTTR